MLKIETGVPLPNGVSAVRKSKYSYLIKMKVKQSVVCDTANEAQGVYHFLTRNKFKAVKRQLDNGKYRVWRVA